jgi:hypothetical protein
MVYARMSGVRREVRTLASINTETSYAALSEHYNIRERIWEARVAMTKAVT